MQVLNPYPGLRPFTAEESGFFFGRGHQCDALIERLQKEHFLVVTGVSGSGKSSLVKCGLLSRLYGGYMAGTGSKWRVAIFRPGSRPVENLAFALADPKVLGEPEPVVSEGIEGLQKVIFESTLDRGDLGLKEVVRMSRLGADENLLLIVDQFEELFRFSRAMEYTDERKQQAIDFVNLLLAGARQRAYPIYIVLTMRSEFLGECTRFRGLAEKVNSCQFLIPRMTRQELEEAIAGPAMVSGTEISRPLIQRLLNDLNDDPDQLPLLQHALMRVWDLWKAEGQDDQPIGLRHYEAIGTMRASLSRHAEEAFSDLAGEGERQIAMLLFKAITEMDEDHRMIRRPQTFKRLVTHCGTKPERLAKVIEVFRQPGRSFLMPPYSQPLREESVIDLSHESLMRVWERLRDWVREEFESRSFYQRLSAQAALYEKGECALWRNPELQLGLKWRKEQQPNALWARRYDQEFNRAMQFLEASQAQFEAELAEQERDRKRKLQRARRVAAIMGFAAVGLIMLLVWVFLLKQEAISQKLKAQHAKQDAEENLKRARTAEQVAEENARMAAENAHEAFLSKLLSDSLADHEKFFRIRAEESRLLALEAKDKEQKARELAERLRKLAELKRAQAERAKVKADSSAKVAMQMTERERAARKETERYRFLSLARALALMAPYADGDELKALLAFHAFQYHQLYHGPEHSPELYRALYAGNKAIRGEDFNVFYGHSGSVRILAADPSSDAFFSSGSDGRVLKWSASVPGSQPKEIFKGNEVIQAMAVSSRGDKLVCGGEKGKLYACSLLFSGEHPRVLNGHRSPVTCLQFSPDDRFLLSGDAGGKLIIRESPSVGGGHEIPGSAPVLAIAVHPNSSIAVFSTAAGAVISVDYELGIVQDTLVSSSSDTVSALAFDHSGSLLAWGSQDGSVTLWGWADQRRKSVQLRSKGEISGVSFSPDNKHLGASSMDGSLLIWDVQAMRNPPIILDDHNDWVHTVIYSPSSGKLLTGDELGLIKYWPDELGELVKGYCSFLPRNMKPEEWKDLVGTHIPYQTACP